MTTKSQLLCRAIALRSASDVQALKLCKIMSDLYDCSDSFAEDCDTIGIGYRKGYYLVQVYKRIVAKKPLSAGRLASIGWTKLSTICSQINEDADVAYVREWLSIAEDTSVTELKLLIKGGKRSTKSVTFRVSKAERKAVEAALVRFGMTVVGRGKYVDRDLAFMAMVRAAPSVV